MCETAHCHVLRRLRICVAVKPRHSVAYSRYGLQNDETKCKVTSSSLSFSSHDLSVQELSYRKQIACQLRTQYVKGIYMSNYP